MQEHQKRVDLTNGGTLITIFTEDGKNREGLSSLSVTHYPGLPCLGLQRGGGNNLPYLVMTIEEIRLVHEATGVVLARLTSPTKPD